MCQFFSFVTEPEHHGGRRFYFDWDYRKAHLKEDDADSHDHIISYYGLDDDMCNTYEYNPLTRVFEVDAINSRVDDRVQAQEWVEQVDWKTIVEPLVIKPIVNPFSLPEATITDEIIDLLHQWASVRASVMASVWDSVRDSVADSVGASVRASVWDSVADSVAAYVWASVWASVGASVWYSVGAYVSSFFAIEYEHDFSSAVRLLEMGIVPSYDGTTWRLHSGKKAEVIYEERWNTRPFEAA